MFRRGLIGYLPVNIAQGLVGLLTIVVFTRLLSPAEFGAYAVGYSVMTLVHTLLFTWNEAAMARFWARASEDGETAEHTATALSTWAALLIVPPVLAVGAWLAPVGPELKLALVAGLLAIIPRSFAKLIQERRRAAGEVGNAAGIDLIQTIGGFGLGAALVVADLGAAGVLLGYGIAAAAAIVPGLGRETRIVGGGGFQSARAKANARYGVPVAASLILALGLASVDRLMLAYFLDEAAVGAYHAGYSLANRTLDVLFIWLGAAGGPALIMALERGGQAALGSAARDQARLMAFITLPAAVGLALVSQPLAHLLVGRELASEAAHVTPWIAASGLFGGVTTYYLHQAFVLGRRTEMLIAAMAVPAVANITLCALLIPAMGLDGALWAAAIGYALGAAASFALGRRVLALPIPWLDLAKCALASALMALAVFRLPAVGGLVELAAKAGVGVVVYGLAAYALDAAGVRSRLIDLIRAARARTA